MNVVLISIDTLRFDCVGYQPDKREIRKYNLEGLLQTPTLDGIAEKSICFTNCFSTNTYTTSAHAGVFTGLYPPKHGVRGFFHTKLSPDVLTLAEVFRDKGYETVMATDKLELFEPLDLDRGFDHVFTRDDGGLFEFLNRPSDKNFFLFAHFFDVHGPYLYSECPPHKDYNADYLSQINELYKRYGRKMNQEIPPKRAFINLFTDIGFKPEVLFPIYVRGVSKFDQGRLRVFMEKLDRISPPEGTLLVIFADHGEGETSRGANRFSHGGDLFDNVLRVPLIVRHPDVRPGISENITSLVDIFPTILKLSGMETGQTTDGVFMGKGREHIYAETWLPSADPFKEPNMQFAYTLIGDFMAGRIERYCNVSWLVRQRCIRTPSMKFVISGEHEPWLEEYLKNSGMEFKGVRGLSKYFRALLRMFRINHFSPDSLPEGAEATFGLPDEEFFRQIVRTVLSNVGSEVAFKKYLWVIKSGLMAKGDVFMALLESEKYAKTPKYFACDCESDPSEEKPLNIFSNTALNEEAQRYYELISRIEASAVQTKMVWSEEAELSGKTEVQAEAGVSLGEKMEKSIEVIKRAVALYGIESIGVAWTGGKDSTTVLSLIRQAFQGKIPFVVVNLDTSVKFPEIYEFREMLKKKWSLDLRIFKNEEALNWIKIAADHKECCYQLKTVPLNNAIKSLGLKALLTGVRWDEQEARSGEEYFSRREEPSHVRVQPILNFTEKDIWRYIREHEVPYCSLYERGYRSLGCAPCTVPSDGTGPERQGRSLDKEAVMQTLRDLGYF